MNVKNYTILSVNILKAGMAMSYYDMKTDRNINIEDIKNSPHPDLVAAIQGFSEYIARVHLVPKEKYGNIVSTGFAIKSDTIVILKGMLTAPSEKKLAINSDAIDLSKDAYGFESDLQTVVDIVISEAGKYLFEGKMIKQAKLEFEDEADKADNQPPGNLEDVDIPPEIKGVRISEPKGNLGEQDKALADTEDVTESKEPVVTEKQYATDEPEDDRNVLDKEPSDE